MVSAKAMSQDRARIFDSNGARQDRTAAFVSVRITPRQIASLAIRKFTFLRLATFLVFVFCGFADVLHAQDAQNQPSDAERASYGEALAYCQGVAPRPMVLRDDKRVLCLDASVIAFVDLSAAKDLLQGGLFVVRSEGIAGEANIKAAIRFAEFLLAKDATVIIRDYCLGLCANFFFIASTKTIVPKGAVVAWINHATGSDNCFHFFEINKDEAPRFQQLPCSFPEMNDVAKEIVALKDKFYKARILSSVGEPPEGEAVRENLYRRFYETGQYPVDVYWTWNPRYHSGLVKTKVFYEAYPKDQGELDAMLTRLGLPYQVIYDP